MKRGAMLVEVVLSIALVAMVFLSVIELYPSSFVAHARARERVFASHLTESLLDHCAALPLDVLLPPPRKFVQWSGASPGPLLAEFEQLPQCNGHRFESLVSVERKDVDAQGHTSLVRVVVLVRWNNHRLERSQWFAQYSR